MLNMIWRFREHREHRGGLGNIGGGMRNIGGFREHRGV